MVSPVNSIPHSGSVSFCDECPMFEEDLDNELTKSSERYLDRFKWRALENGRKLLSSLPSDPKKRVAELLSAAAMLVESDVGEETDDEDAPKRPISTRLSLAALNRDPKVASLACDLLRELKFVGSFVPESAEDQLDMVWITYQMEIDDVKGHRESLKK